jgi:hypothetical protein
MGHEMDYGTCADCEMLHEVARDAIMQHVYTESKLSIAKLQHDSPKTRVLEPLVETLFQTRSAAVRAYQEHVDTHTQKAAQSGI